MATEQIIIEGIDKTQRAFSSVQKNLTRVESNTNRSAAAFGRLRNLVLGAAAAIGGIKLAKGFLNTAVEVENLGIQLKFLTGSAEEGAKAMDILTKFAGGVPFELQQIANAAPNLLTVVDSTDELNELLAITGDIAASTGLSFKETAEQLQRSFSGGIAAADMFREKGVKALLGFEEGVRYNADQTKKMIVESYRDGTMVMKGASAEMANTFTGTMSMLSDKLFQFQKKLMDGGPFDFLKALMKSLDSYIQERFGSIQAAADQMGQKMVQAFQAATIGLARFGDMIAPIVRFAGSAIKGLVEMTNGLPATIKALGLIGFLMLGIKGKLVVLIIGGVFNKIKLMFAEVMDFMAAGKDKLASVADAIGMDEAAKKLRKNAEEIRQHNEKIRKAIKDGKDSIVSDNEDIVVSMGKFGEITEEELSKAGPLVQKLVSFYKQLNEETERNKRIRELSMIDDPIIEQYKQSQKVGIETEKALGAEAEKQAKRKLFIDTELHKSKMKFHQMEREGVKKFNEDNISYLQAYTEGFRGEIGKQISVLDQLRDAGANAFNGMVDTLTNFVMTGKMAFKDFANMVIRDLIRIAIQAAATFAIKAALKALGGPVGGFLGGFLADGGPAKAGTPYVVGEKGPELFVPNSSGTVIPNDQMRSGGSGAGTGSKPVNVFFQVTAMDSQSFQETLSEQRDTIVGIVNEAVMDKGRPAIA